MASRLSTRREIDHVRLRLPRVANRLFALALAMTAGIASGEDFPVPATVVELMTRTTLEVMSREGAAMAADPERYYALARNTLKPHFDLERACRVILGPSWSTATPAERKDFQRAFEDYLITSYAVALRHITATTFTVTGEPRPVGTSEVLLPVSIVFVDGEVVNAELRMRLGSSGWRIWDASGGGLSMIRLYRGDIGTEAAVHGIAHTVDSLQKVSALNRVRNAEDARKRAAAAVSR